MEYRIPLTIGIQNPCSIGKESEIHYLESRIQSLEARLSWFPLSVTFNILLIIVNQ